MKILLVLVCFLILLCHFSATQIPAQQNNPSQQNNPFEDLMDGKRMGLFAGGSVAYGSARFTLSRSDGDEIDEWAQEEVAELNGLSGGLKWRLGYATSEKVAFYVTSVATNLEPSLGVMIFSEKYLGYYFNALVGYTSYEADFLNASEDDNLSTWNVGAGLGYEFRPHFTLEFTLGYSRLTVPIYDDLDGYVNNTTLFASFNYLFY